MRQSMVPLNSLIMYSKDDIIFAGIFSLLVSCRHKKRVPKNLTE